MSRVIFCRSNLGGGSAAWCIRPLTVAGPKYTGRIDSPSLCGRVTERFGGVDVRAEITLEKLRNPAVVCSDCVAQLRQLAIEVLL